MNNQQLHTIFMRILISLVLMSLINITYAEDSISGHYFSYRPLSDGEELRSRIDIDKQSDNEAHLRVTVEFGSQGIYSPNSTKYERPPFKDNFKKLCEAEVSGKAKIQNNKLILMHQPSNSSCSVVVEVIENKASVISAKGCTGNTDTRCNLESANNLYWEFKGRPLPL